MALKKYKNDEVIELQEKYDLVETIFRELKFSKDLIHDCINRLIGVSFDIDDELIYSIHQICDTSLRAYLN